MTDRDEDEINRELAIMFGYPRDLVEATTAENTHVEVRLRSGKVRCGIFEPLSERFFQLWCVRTQEDDLNPPISIAFDAVEEYLIRDEHLHAESCEVKNSPKEQRGRRMCRRCSEKAANMGPGAVLWCKHPLD